MFILVQYEGEVMMCFVRQFMNELQENWILIDDGGNNNVVKFNMSNVRPRLTLSWYQLRDFYDLKGTCPIWMHFMEDSVFNISIYNSDCKEIYVPGDPLQYIYKSDDDADDFYNELPKIIDSFCLNVDSMNLPQLQSFPPSVILNSTIENDGSSVSETNGVVAIAELKTCQEIYGASGQEVDAANDEVINDVFCCCSIPKCWRN